MAGGGRQGGVNFPGCAQAVEQFVSDGIQLAAAVVRAIGQRALLAIAFVASGAALGLGLGKKRRHHN